jgi:catechol 2,3-dioxygenase-like lactoylglutathione lyase family enzyme
MTTETIETIPSAASTKTSAVEFATETRVHVAINVDNVERSLPFYQTLFGQVPTKIKTGYAKFEVAMPPVNFTLNENIPAKNVTGSLSHMGIQVKNTQAVLDAKQRFIEAGLATFTEEDVTCCYAVQDKVWVTDPDGNQWEVFVVLDAEAESYHPIGKDGAESACCAVDTVPVEVKGRSLPVATACC